MYGFMQNNYCPAVGQFEGQNFTAKAMEKMIVEDISPKEAVEYLEELMLNVNKVNRADWTQLQSALLP